MKTKYTKQQIKQLNKMNNGAFIIIKQHWFDLFLKTIGRIINGGKSIVPAELKGF